VNIPAFFLLLPLRFVGTVLALTAVYLLAAKAHKYSAHAMHSLPPQRLRLALRQALRWRLALVWRRTSNRPAMNEIKSILLHLDASPGCGMPKHAAHSSGCWAAPHVRWCAR
jgi:hypothetical protein